MRRTGKGVEAGFTLVELMTVLLIMGILLGIAIPSFFGATNTANDRSAQADLNTTLTDLKAIYMTGGGPYPPIAQVLSALAIDEPNLSFGDTTSSTGPLSIEVFQVLSVASLNDDQGMVIAAWSNSGYCWVAADIEAHPTENSGWWYDTSGPWGTPNPGVYYGVFNLGASDCFAGLPGALPPALFSSWVSSGFPPE